MKDFSIGPRHAPGGVPGLFLLKTVILVFCLLMALQGLSLAGRSLLVLRGDASMLPPDGDQPAVED